MAHDVYAITPDEMEKLVVRFGDQRSVRDRVTNLLKIPIPDWFFGRVVSRDTFNLIGKTTNAADQFAIQGPKDTAVVLARMPPNHGPVYLHLHKNTWEIFFVLSGTFRVRYGVDGEHVCDLAKYDSIAIPPKVVRNFENT
jgi:mannose-6-phosphate isomerase-like protein (cupin superfamily)